MSANALVHAGGEDTRRQGGVIAKISRTLRGRAAPFRSALAAVYRRS
jgi:hypothetical protein